MDDHRVKYFGIIAAIAIAFVTDTHAKEYLGFNLCGETTKSKVEDVLKAHSAKIVATRSDFAGSFTYKTGDFQIKGKGHALDVTIFNGKIYSVSIMLSDDLVEDIKQLYGKPVKISNEPNEVGYSKYMVYEDKENIDVPITQSQIHINYQGKQLDISGLAYLCKPLSSQVEILVNQEKSKKAKSSGL